MNEDIEITEEMIEAGRGVIAGYSLRFESEEYWVEKIYRAMRTVEHKEREGVSEMLSEVEEFFHREHAKHRRMFKVVGAAIVVLGALMMCVGLYALHLASEMSHALSLG